jgi:hypothetical protein
VQPPRDEAFQQRIGKRDGRDHNRSIMGRAYALRARRGVGP